MTPPPPTAAAGTHARNLFGALAGFWGLFVILYTLSAVLRDGWHQVEYIPRRVLTAMVGVGLSLAMYQIQSRISPTRTVIKMLTVGVLSLLAASIFSVANRVIFEVMSHFTGETCFNGKPCEFEQLRLLTIEYAVNWTFVFLLWGLLHDWIVTADRARIAERHAAVDRETARRAALDALRYQLNPHFLFNCLNGLSTLVGRRESAAAEAMIGEMATFIRASLAPDPGGDVAVQDEIDTQLLYLELERRRFPGLTVAVSVDPAAAGALVPPLILQPLVENAVKHGVGRSTVPVTISISAFAERDRLRLVVEDVAAEPVSRPAGTSAGFGIGLRNVSERLSLRFGADATSLESTALERGYRVELVMPVSLPGADR